MVAAGNRAVMFYFVQRSDCKRFTVAADLDPEYAKTLKSAMKQGVAAICYDARVTMKEISVRRPLALDLPA